MGRRTELGYRKPYILRIGICKIIALLLFKVRYITVCHGNNICIRRIVTAYINRKAYGVVTAQRGVLCRGIVPWEHRYLVYSLNTAKVKGNGVRLYAIRLPACGISKCRAVFRNYYSVIKELRSPGRIVGCRGTWGCAYNGFLGYCVPRRNAYYNIGISRDCNFAP